ncbi:NUDIX domain-containing protein [Leifsonia sp. EB34]|uniref:NUDIX domain-containing protein n=1 Tax=Leifsonia sp. EB34 TaxID=3156303 RepID=UPI00351835BE
MPMSEYVRSIRERIGNDLLLLPAVTAVIRDGERFLLARGVDSAEWSLIGGGVEPGEQPAEALAREVYEETGAALRITAIVGVYGGEPLMVDYPNGDRAGYVTTAYECHVVGHPEPDGQEIAELGWFGREEIAALPRQGWIDQVIADAR